MKQINLTYNTKNSKKLRKKVYESAMKFIDEESKSSFFSGFCYAISMAFNKNISGFEFSVFSMANPNNIYTELMEYKPKRNYQYSIYWFPRNEYGSKKRVKILKEIINSM